MTTLPRHRWIVGLRRRGVTFDPAAPYVVSIDGGSVTVDTTHPAYPRKPIKARKPAALAGDLPIAPVGEQIQTQRRATCEACEHHGEITTHTAHCRKIGNRPSCVSCRVVFATSPAARCPLGLWQA